MERFKFFQLLKQHEGKLDKDFPFNAVDMARFILRVLKKDLPEIPDIVEEMLDPVIQCERPGVMMAQMQQQKLIIEAREREIDDLKKQIRVGKKRQKVFQDIHSDDFSQSKRYKSDEEDLQQINGGGSLSVNLDDVFVNS